MRWPGVPHVDGRRSSEDRGMAETLLVVGLQWGDEGKGKIIDALADRFDVIIRFQGGAR